MGVNVRNTKFRLSPRVYGVSGRVIEYSCSSAMETPPSISDELLSESREAFNLFDNESAGSIRTKDVGLVLRSLGFSLSVTELAAMEKDADPDALGFVKFPAFERQLGKAVVLAKASSAEAKKSIRNLGQSIQMLLEKKSLSDADGEFISVHDLKHVMTRIGEKISPDEFSELCRDLDIEGGRIRVEQLVNYLVI